MITITEKTLTGMTFIDLFAGLGGFRLALESLGATFESETYSCELPDLQ